MSGRRRRRGRLVEGLGWIAFGLVLGLAAWRMPRLESLNITPWSAPGLLPGVVGVLIMAGGMTLLLGRDDSSVSHDGPVPDDGPVTHDESSPPSRQGTAAVAATLLLCLGYAGGLVGHGLPFVAASAGFLAVFIGWFRWPVWRQAGRGAMGRGLAATAAIAGAVAFLLAWLFESVFLVRLP